MIYNNVDNGEYHSIKADGWANTGYIPAEDADYVSGKWCVTLDVRLT